MTMNQQTDEIEESEPEIFACSGCGAKQEANTLFVGELSRLAKIKGEEDGEANAFITPEDLPRFALCEDCSDVNREPYTLAESIASSRAYQRSRSGRNKPTSSKRSSHKAISQAIVTDAEANELVSCFNCEALGEETLIPRHEATAPGWMGCNILMAYRLQKAKPLADVSITPANLSKVGYVSSEDLLQSGKEGFVACPECMKTMIPDLRKDALDIGFSEDEIAEKIQPWLLVPMIKSVRRKERKKPR